MRPGDERFTDEIPMEVVTEEKKAPKKKAKRSKTRTKDAAHR